jgi:alpha-mannosidase
MLGQQSLTPLQTMLTKRPGPRPLPPAGGFLAIDHPQVQLLAMKRAEDGNGVVLRLRNPGSEAAQARPTGPHEIRASVPARGIRTVRVIGEARRR